MGGGPYEPETVALRERLNADGVVVIVKGGDRGDGFEMALDLEGIRELPRVLRELAATLELVPICAKHGPFHPTQEGVCPACWRGE